MTLLDAKRNKNGRYELRASVVGSKNEYHSIIKTHDSTGKPLINQWGGHTPMHVGSPKYVKKHWSGIKHKLDENFEQYFVKENWLKSKNNPNHYTAWGAEVDHHKGDLHCPKCGKVISRANLHFNPVRDNTPDNEVTHWEHGHDCGAKLTVFNDSYKPEGNLVEEEKTMIDEVRKPRVPTKAVHVMSTTKHKNGKPAYKVVKSTAPRIKVGEHLTDSELDDLVETGHKIQTVKEDVGPTLYNRVLDTLFEARRGRPRKNPPPPGSVPLDDEHEADRHITMQIRKAKNLAGLKHVEFANGERVQVPADHAHKYIAKYDTLKPHEREEMQKKAQRSHADFLSVINS